VCMYLREGEGERGPADGEQVCVCMYVREREGERGPADGEQVCVCMCEREREREDLPMASRLRRLTPSPISLQKHAHSPFLPLFLLTLDGM
jgi:hypothetical protein